MHLFGDSSATRDELSLAAAKLWFTGLKSDFSQSPGQNPVPQQSTFPSSTMGSENILKYKDGNDDVLYSIDPRKYALLNDAMKRHVMKNLLRIHEQNLDFISSPQIEAQSGKVFKSAPIGGYSSSRPFNRRPGPIYCPPPKKMGVPMKFDLGVLPSDEFRFSSDTSSMPSYYRVEQTATPLPRILNCSGVSAPINVLIGNLAVLKQNSNAHNFVAATGLYSSQTPSQSFFTYFYGSAIDQYYQIVRNGYQ